MGYSLYLFRVVNDFSGSGGTAPNNSQASFQNFINRVYPLKNKPFQVAIR
jgi:hypothetical protein